MGNSSSESFSSVNLSDYSEVSQTADYRVLKHVTTGRELQEHRLYFNDEQELKKYEQMVRWRNNQDYIVEAVGFNSLTTQKLCSRIITANVYIEHPLVKLSDIKDIPHPESIYMAKACLQGFSKLYYRIGYFPIEQNLIGINHQGKVKVWFNKNMSSNIVSISVNRSEQIMVRSIIDIIDTNSDPMSKALPLAKYIGHKRCKTFEDLRELLRLYELQHGGCSDCTRILDILKPIEFPNKTMIMDLKSESSTRGLSKTVMINESNTIINRIPVPVTYMVHNVRKSQIDTIPTKLRVQLSNSLHKRQPTQVTCHTSKSISRHSTTQTNSQITQPIKMPPKLKNMPSLPLLSKHSQNSRHPTQSCKDSQMTHQVSEPLEDRTNTSALKMHKMPSAVERTMGSMADLNFKNSTKSLVLSSEQLKKKLKDARKSQNIFSEKSESEAMPLTREELQQLDPQIAADILMLNL